MQSDVFVSSCEQEREREDAALLFSIFVSLLVLAILVDILAAEEIINDIVSTTVLYLLLILLIVPTERTVFVSALNRVRYSLFLRTIIV